MSILFLIITIVLAYLGISLFQFPLTPISASSIFYYIGLVGAFVVAGILWLAKGKTRVTSLTIIEGRIVRWNQYMVKGETRYAFVVEGHEDKLLRVDLSHSQATVTQLGDIVCVESIDTATNSWLVYSFENLTFSFSQGDSYVEGYGEVS